MPKKKKSLLSEIIPEHDEQEFMDEYYNDPKTSKKSRSVALGILSLFPATNLFKALNLLKNFKTAKNLSVKDTFNPKKWDSKLKSKLEKLSDVSAGQAVGILASGGKDMVIERAEKNKGGILNNDKDRIGYQEGKDVDVEKGDLGTAGNAIDLGAYSSDEQEDELNIIINSKELGPNTIVTGDFS